MIKPEDELIGENTTQLDWLLYIHPWLKDYIQSEKQKAFSDGWQACMDYLDGPEETEFGEDSEENMINRSKQYK